MGLVASSSYKQHHFNFNFQYNFSKVYTEYIFNVNCEYFKHSKYKYMYITMEINQF